jgi:hypothetical protein
MGSKVDRITVRLASATATTANGYCLVPYLEEDCCRQGRGSAGGSDEQDDMMPRIGIQS